MIGLRLVSLGVIVGAALAVACTTTPAAPTSAPKAAATTAATAAATAAPGSTATAASKVPPGVAQVLNWGQTEVAAQINPYDQGFPSGFIVRPLFDRLVDANSYEPQPMLATAWRQVNPTTWEFTLRQGPRFHNGDPVTAEDIKFSLDNGKDPMISSATAAAGTFGLLDTVTITNPTTIVLTTKAPDVALFTKLNTSPVYSKKAFEAAGGPQNFYQKPVGSGPFKVKTFTTRQEAIHEGNKEYWGGAPILSEIRFKGIGELAVRVQALTTKEIDIAADIAVDALPQLAASQSKPLTQNFPVMVSILFDAQTDQLKDKRVRQALNYSIDKITIVRELQGGLAELPQGQPLIKALPGHNPSLQPFTYDVARARALMAEAGFPNGFTVDYPYAAFQSSFKPLAEVSARYMEAIGVRTNIRAIDLPTFSADLRGNTLGPFRLSAFDCSSGDPGTCLLSYQSRARGGIGRWENAQFDALYAQQTVEFDRARRSQQLQQMMAIMNDDPPALFFYAFVYNWGVSPRAGEFTTARTAMPAFEKVIKLSN